MRQRRELSTSAQLTRNVPELVVEGERSNASVDASVGLGENYQSSQLSTPLSWERNTRAVQANFITYISTVNKSRYMLKISAIVLHPTMGRQLGKC